MITHLQFVAYSCLATAIAYGAPDASYGGYGVGLAHGIAAPAIHAPATVTKTITRPKCTVTYEEIETQNCIPKEEKDCTTEEVEQEYVEYERDCKETTSKECGPSRHLGIIKREAEVAIILYLVGYLPILCQQSQNLNVHWLFQLFIKCQVLRASCWDIFN